MPPTAAVSVINSTLLLVSKDTSYILSSPAESSYLSAVVEALELPAFVPRVGVIALPINNVTNGF